MHCVFKALQAQDKTQRGCNNDRIDDQDARVSDQSGRRNPHQITDREQHVGRPEVVKMRDRLNQGNAHPGRNQSDRRPAGKQQGDAKQRQILQVYPSAKIDRGVRLGPPEQRWELGNDQRRNQEPQRFDGSGPRFILRSRPNERV
jgi:hypothetical protein